MSFDPHRLLPEFFNFFDPVELLLLAGILKTGVCLNHDFIVGAKYFFTGYLLKFENMKNLMRAESGKYVELGNQFI